MTMQDTARIRVIFDMERLIGEGDWPRAGAHFTTDARYQVGALEPYYGIRGIREYMEGQMRIARWEGHTPRLMLEIDDTVIIEVDSHFHRLSDTKKVTLPCTDIYRFEGMQIADWRVYADLTAFSAP